MKKYPLLFLYIGILAAAFCARQALSDTTARVQIASYATFKRSSAKTYVTLNSRTSLNTGDVVRTGATGKASLLFYDGSQVRLGANSALEITPPTDVGGGRKSFFRALSGQVWARLRPGTAVQTNAAVAGVRGTEILLKVADDDTTTLTVLEGVVDFYNPFGAVVVNTSQQSVAAIGHAPTSPITIDNPGLLIEWTFDLDYAVLPREKFWTALAGDIPDSTLAARAATAQVDPNNIEAQRIYGDTLFDMRRYQEALAVYQQAAQKAPANSFGVRLGYTFLELGDLDKAEAQFRAALTEATTNIAIAPQSQARFQDVDWSPRQVKVQTVAAKSTFNVPALIGMAWLELTRNRAADAEKWAQQAIIAEPGNAEALIALGVSQLRQTNKLESAIANFKLAQTVPPENLHYQAQAWEALALLAQGNNVEALTQAQDAVKTQPDSGLARGNLALALLYNGKAYDSAKEAQRAVALNPDAVAARVALAQTLLARGDTDAAAREAATASALDPQLPQAFYVLGLADASRRDYSHAARELQDSLKIDPDFLPAAAALARVYNLMGREKDAAVLLTDFQARFPKSNEVYAAFGQVYYQQGNYHEAALLYQKAVELQPNSALYQAELARVLLDDNQLNGALRAGQQAVFLAPQVGEYHALLGLVAQFSNLASYADREYRIGLALDPQNALARVELGLNNSDPRVGDNAITQAFLYDPTISRQLFRGGINTELSLSDGTDNSPGTLLGNRAQNKEGSIYSYGIAAYTSSDGTAGAPNDNSRLGSAEEYLTWLPDNKTSVLFHGADSKSREGYDGPTLTLDDSFHFDDWQGSISARRRIGQNDYLWLGGTYDSSGTTTLDPNSDSNYSESLPSFLLFDPRDDRRTKTFEPEVRLDLNLTARPERRTTLTFGAAFPKATSLGNGDVSALVLTLPPYILPYIGEENDALVRHDKIFYAQIASRLSNKLSFVAQLQHQNIDSLFSETSLGVVFPDSSTNENRTLPALLVNYQLDNKTALRFFANRRSQDVGFQTFLPTEALLSSESAALPQGVSAQTRLYELDMEHYFSPRTFGKIFVFHSSASNLVIGDSSNFLEYITADEARRTGVGARLEHQLTNTLFASLEAVDSRTVGGISGPFLAPINGVVPFQPSRVATLTLNYVDPRGYKAAVRLNYESSFFSDDQFTAPTRPITGGQATVDLYLAREPSLKNEVSLNVFNVLNSARTFVIGWTRRF